MTDDKKQTHFSTNSALRWIASQADHAVAKARVLDLACGGGRHGRAFLAKGCRVTFVDIDTTDVADLTGDPDSEILRADLEGAPWPLAGRSFDTVVVVNYLWRPILPDILDAVSQGGDLLYQTFAIGNERFGRPRNPDFLLQPGELKDIAEAAGFTVLDFFEGEVTDPKPAVIQRVHARKAG